MYRGSIAVAVASVALSGLSAAAAVSVDSEGIATATPIKHLVVIFDDHVMPPIVNRSHDPANDALLGPTGLCGIPPAGAYPDRCGYGPRLPLLAISPLARRNYVAHTVTDFASIIRFIEDNWRLGRLGDQSFDAIAGPMLDLFDFGARPAPALFLAPDTGEPTAR